MTDTTPVPSDLLARIAAASNAGKVEELRSLATQLPQPPKPRLRVINLDTADKRWERRDFLYFDRIEDEPDVMTVIEQAIHEWQAAGGMVTVETLVARVRAALEGATQ